MVVVGKKLTSVVRYGVNAGIWGYLKWFSNIIEDPSDANRNLQGQKKQSSSQQG